MSDSLLKTLFEIKKTMPHIPMRGFNPYHKSKYIKLNDIMDVIKPIFEKHELICMQYPGFMDGAIYVETRITHLVTGEFVSANVGCAIKADPQSAGAAITYLRRYGLVSMLGLVEEDDDGEIAMSRAPVKDLESTVLARLSSLILSKNLSSEVQDAILKKAGVNGLEKLTTEQALKTIEWLESK